MKQRTDMEHVHLERIFILLGYVQYIARKSREHK